MRSSSLQYGMIHDYHEGGFKDVFRRMTRKKRTTNETRLMSTFIEINILIEFILCSYPYCRMTDCCANCDASTDQNRPNFSAYFYSFIINRDALTINFLPLPSIKYRSDAVKTKLLKHRCKLSRVEGSIYSHIYGAAARSLAITNGPVASYILGDCNVANANSGRGIWVGP